MSFTRESYGGYEARVKCASLAWHTLHVALKGHLTAVSTKRIVYEKAKCGQREENKQMKTNEWITLSRICEGIQIPSGKKVMLPAALR
jgi:hypothetical protein